MATHEADNHPGVTHHGNEMKSAPVRIALIATAALLLGGVGLAVVAGQQTQRDVQEQLGRTKKALEDSGLATMVSSPYQGNALGGTQVTTLTLMPESDEPFVITLTSHVHNGPFPQGKAFGAATVTTDVTFPADVQKTLDQAFGGQKISLQTLVKFGGNSVTTYRVPAGQFTEEGMTATWKAASGTVTAEGDRVRSDGQWPGLTMKGDGGLVTVGDSTWFMTGENAADGLGDAAATLNIGAIQATEDGKTLFSFGPVKAESAVQSDAKFVSSSATYHVAKAAFEDQTLDNLNLKVTVGHLDRQALAKLSRLDLEAEDFDPDALNPIIEAVLKGAPTLSIDRFSVGSGKDEVQLTAKAALKAGANVDWSTLMLNPAALMSLLTVQAHAEGEAQAIEALAGDLAPGEADVGMMLQAAQEQGILVKKGSRLVTDVQLDQTGVKVNGVSMQ
ncbi:hypothetical protein GCM10010842_37170 [Deinococcus daejeonensis]|uniref:DUF945 domain-containing protein n=2 Tax=Deinococcus daejeonensis TaxID=1007098 RepID=A0ABQ2JFL0_9DEIO|nr:hypothetical protein GCM10010842_37170 [Deinococcus daejeonensis]